MKLLVSSSYFSFLTLLVTESLYQSLKLLNYLDPLEPPLIFFGHSYGGIIAYELAQLLLHRDEYLLPHLIISSTNNPQLLASRSSNSEGKKHHLLSDERLLEEILHHGGLPAGVHIDILRHMLPVIRGDYKGLETYSPSDHVKACDGQCDGDLLVKYPGYMTILGSENDPGDVTQESLQNWHHQSAYPDEKFSLHFFPSESHFYFLEPSNSTSFFEKLSEICCTPFQCSFSPHGP